MTVPCLYFGDLGSNVQSRGCRLEIRLSGAKEAHLFWYYTRGSTPVCIYLEYRNTRFHHILNKTFYFRYSTQGAI